MFQMSFASGIGDASLIAGKISGESVEISGLEGLFRSVDGQMPVFSAELQSLLYQMTPQMLQRLENLLAGGMKLPEAASQLLTEAGEEGIGRLFAGLMAVHAVAGRLRERRRPFVAGDLRAAALLLQRGQPSGAGGPQVGLRVRLGRHDVVAAPGGRLCHAVGVAGYAARLAHAAGHGCTGTSTAPSA